MKTLLLVLVLLLVASSAFGQVPTKPDLLEVIELKTIIGEGAAATIASQVERINETPKVKAVLLVVDTPGGGASASAVVYQELAKLKVPVVGYCEYLCASGGMYALMAPSVKYIAVRDDTIAGSVGVIMQAVRYNRLLEWAKIDSETYKSGSLKDAGNPTRSAQDEERKYLQNIIDQLASKFYGVVAQARKDKITAHRKEIESARIFIGADTVRVGLADAVMTRAEAEKKAKELSGSKLIFTRQELKKMSKAADEPAGDHHMAAPLPSVQARLENDLAFLVETLREIKQGESIQFQYLMPLKF